MGLALTAAVILSGCMGVGSGAPATTTTSIAAPGAVIADLAPTTLVGEGSDAAPTPAPIAGGAGQAVAVDQGAPAPGRGLSTPEAAARNLWDAWRDADGPRALLYAVPGAVDTMFASPWSPEIRRSGCTVVEAGHLCRFEGPELRWDLLISGDTSTGFRVESVTTGEPVGVDLDQLGPAQSVPGAPGAAGTPTDTSVPGAGGPGDTAPPSSSVPRRKAKRTTTTTSPEPAPEASAAPKSNTAATPAPADQPTAPADGAPAPVPVARPVQGSQ